MGYVENNRLPDEELIVEAEHHVAAFVGPAALGIAGIALMSLVDGLFYLGLVLLLVGIWRTGKTAVAFLTDEMALTDERVIGKSGLLRRDSMEFRNEFVSGLSVDQSILGRILNYGTIIVDGEGDDDVGISYVKNPQELRNTVQGHLAEQT